MFIESATAKGLYLGVVGRQMRRVMTKGSFEGCNSVTLYRGATCPRKSSPVARRPVEDVNVRNQRILAKLRGVPMSAVYKGHKDDLSMVKTGLSGHAARVREGAPLSTVPIGCPFDGLFRCSLSVESGQDRLNSSNGS